MRHCVYVDLNSQQEPWTTDASTTSKRRWSDLSPAARIAIVLAGIVELILTTIAVRDLTRRSGKDVRGGKLPWLLAFLVQPFGPLAYFAVGRREA